MRPRKALDIYLSDFRERGSARDLLRVFEQVRERFGCQNVLYPGSYLHVTPSLVFPRVCYVDSLKDLGKAFANADLLQYIDANKTYPEGASVKCYQEDYNAFDSEPEASFDLLISLNAGFISQACKRFLRLEGVLLVNDGHYDASRAYLDPNYELAGTFEGEDQILETSERELATQFKTTKGQQLTWEMLEANTKKSPSRAPFKLARKAEVYLFRKMKA